MNTGRLRSLLFITAFLPMLLSAEEPEKGNTWDKLRENLSVHGLLQTQWNWTNKPDSVTLQSTHGFFNRNVNNRFTVKRGRLALQYTDDIVKAKFQFNINEEGFHVNDAYVKVTEPWLKSLSVTSGIFPRPFGFEVGQSSGDRESPERSRVIQHLYPNTRDLGVMFSYAVPDDKKAQGLQVNLGVFNGNSGNPESNRFKDLVGQIRYDRSFKEGKYAFGIGYSTHWGP